MLMCPGRAWGASPKSPVLMITWGGWMAPAQTSKGEWWYFREHEAGSGGGSAIQSTIWAGKSLFQPSPRAWAWKSEEPGQNSGYPPYCLTLGKLFGFFYASIFLWTNEQKGIYLLKLL